VWGEFFTRLFTIFGCCLAGSFVSNTSSCGSLPLGEEKWTIGQLPSMLAMFFCVFYELKIKIKEIEIKYTSITVNKEGCSGRVN
jgi:hypothetical protein